MSIKVMSDIWDSAEAEGATLLLLLALADFANDDGSCWPSVETLARKARISERHCHRIIGELSASGILTVDRNVGPNGVNVYTLQPRGDTMSPLTPMSPISGVTPVSGVTSEAKIYPQGVDTMSPKPSLGEPSLGSSSSSSSAAARKKRGGGRGDWRVAVMTQLYEETIGGLTPTLADLIRDGAEHVPKGELGERWIKYAFQAAAASGRPSLRYVLAVLKRGEDTGWPADMEVKRDGRTSQAGSRPAGKGARLAAVGPGGPDLDAWDRYARGEDG